MTHHFKQTQKKNWSRDCGCVLWS